MLRLAVLGILCGLWADYPSRDEFGVNRRRFRTPLRTRRTLCSMRAHRPSPREHVCLRHNDGRKRHTTSKTWNFNSLRTDRIERGLHYFFSRRNACRTVCAMASLRAFCSLRLVARYLTFTLYPRTVSSLCWLASSSSSKNSKKSSGANSRTRCALILPNASTRSLLALRKILFSELIKTT